MIYWLIFSISNPEFSSIESVKITFINLQDIDNLIFFSILGFQSSLIINLLWGSDWVVLQDVEKPQQKEKTLLIFRFLKQISKDQFLETD